MFRGPSRNLHFQEADITLDANIDFGLVEGHGVERGQLMECEPPAIVSGTFGVLLASDRN